jgi:hypothetical protein
MYADKEVRGEKSLVHGLIARGIAGQAAILASQLKAGVPLTYRDHVGNLVEEHPDGTITILKTKEQLAQI